MTVDEHLSLSRLDPYGYHALDPAAKYHLQKWMVDNSIIVLHTYLLTYNELTHIVVVHSYEVNVDGRFVINDKRTGAEIAPVREIESATCPWWEK